ncbi:MAG: dihydrofolate reductase family protein [Caldilineaceae bacterium]
MMRKLIVGEFVSLDGVMQAPGGADEDTDGGFAHGGWVLPYWHDDIGAAIGESLGRCDTLLLGRKTWVTHGQAFEPMEPDSPELPFPGFKKYVVSTTLAEASLWRNSTIIADNVVAEVRKLKAQPGKDIYIDGSSVLIHELAPHELIDEYALLVFPLVLGSGKRLFPDGLRVNLKLVETKPFPSGVVLMRYQPARA